MHRQHESGVAVLIIVLFTAMILAAILVVTSSLTIGGRQSGANETAAFQAVLASESGQNAFIVRSRNTAQYGGGVPASCTGSDEQKALCALNAWLTDQGVGTFDVGGGGSVSLVATDATVTTSGGSGVRLTSVDLEARGNTASGQARVLQQYSVTKSDLMFPNVPGAVTSHPSVQLQGGPSSVIAGTSATAVDNTGIYDDLLTVQRVGTPGSALAVGTPVQISVNSSSLDRASQVAVGSYVQLPLSAFSSTLSGSQTGTFKVTANANGTLSLLPIRLPTVSGGTVLPSGNLGLDYVMNGIESYSGNVLTLNSKEAFVQGDLVAVKIGSTTYTATVTNVSGKQVTVGTWSPGNPPSTTPTSLEGTPVTKSTNAVVTAGSFTTGGQASASGAVLQGTAGAAQVPSPLNDELFLKTFGTTPAQLRNLATIYTESQFDGDVTGLTWVTSTDRNVNMNSQKLQGKGILIVDGDLTVNQNQADACGFSGIIYVRGNVDIRGNLQLCGALVVEGSILSTDGLTVAGIDSDDSDFGGNGRKVTYDPEAIFDAVAGAGPYAFARVPGSWRQR